MDTVQVAHILYKNGRESIRTAFMNAVVKPDTWVFYEAYGETQEAILQPVIEWPLPKKKFIGLYVGDNVVRSIDEIVADMPNKADYLKAGE